MRLWIDSEFNGFGGELISMALIDEDGVEWYESAGCANPCDWVSQHVMPFINKSSIGIDQMRDSLFQFLKNYPSIHIVADWPEDISYFCNLLIAGAGVRIDTPTLTMEIRRDLDAISAIPHNALEDAKAMRLVHLSKRS